MNPKSKITCLKYSNVICLGRKAVGLPVSSPFDFMEDISIQINGKIAKNQIFNKIIWSSKFYKNFFEKYFL